MEELKEKEAEELKKKILEKGKMTEQELEAKIKEKTEKFSGMLNKEAAVFLVARELGINSEEKNTLISELKKGSSVNLEAEIVSVFEEREFEKNGKKGKVRNVLLKDNTGTALMALWNEETGKINEEDRGKKIILRDFFVQEFNGKTQLKKGFNSSIELKERKEEEKRIQEKPKKIAEITEGEKNFSVKGRVLREFPLKEFESKGKKGCLKRIELIDETGTAMIVLWDEKTKEKMGKEIELNALNAKKGFNGIEFHSTQNTKVKESEELNALKELCVNFFGVKKLNEISEGQRIVTEGKIKNLNKTKMLFNVCPECRGRIEEENNNFFCKRCGQVLKPEKKMVISFELEDETAEKNTIAYGKQAEKVIGKTTKEINERMEEIIIDELIKELNEEIKGKEISFLGTAKNNSFSGETELVVEKLL
jgi:replication factor A1